MPTSSRLKRAVLRGKTTCLDLRCYGRKRRKPAWRGLPKVSPRRAYQGLFWLLADRADLTKSIKTVGYATQQAQGTFQGTFERNAY